VAYGQISSGFSEMIIVNKKKLNQDSNVSYEEFCPWCQPTYCLFSEVVAAAIPELRKWPRQRDVAVAVFAAAVVATSEFLLLAATNLVVFASDALPSFDRSSVPPIVSRVPFERIFLNITHN